MSVPTTTVTNVQRLKLDLPEGQLVKQKIKELAAFINEEKFQADRIARLVRKQWRDVVCGMLEAKIKGQEMGYLMIFVHAYGTSFPWMLLTPYLMETHLYIPSRTAQFPPPRFVGRIVAQRGQDRETGCVGIRCCRIFRSIPFNQRVLSQSAMNL